MCASLPTLPKLRRRLSVLAFLTALSAAAPAAVLGDSDPGAPATELSGLQLYQINCARCHTRRYRDERTYAQWKTALLHMRMRASLPRQYALKILDYLK